MYPGQPNGAAYSRGGGVLAHQSTVMRQPDSRIQGEPGGRRVLVFREKDLRVRPMLLLLLKDLRARLGSQAEKRIVVLAPDFEAEPSVVFFLLHLQQSTGSYVTRAAIVVEDERCIARPAHIMRAIVMIIGGEGKQQPARHSVSPL